MAMQIISLQVRHDCPFAEVIAQRPGTRATHLCHRGRNAILEVHGPDPPSLEAILDVYGDRGGTLLFEDPESRSALVQFPVCACCTRAQVIPTMESHGTLYLPPSSYSQVGESYQFMRTEGIDAAPALEAIRGRAEVLEFSTHPLETAAFEGDFLVPAGALFRGLTDRQRSALLLAVSQGYYRIPRGTTTQALGQRLGISREAFEALLRKAENKLIWAAVPYLKESPPPDEAGLPATGDAPPRPRATPPGSPPT